MVQLYRNSPGLQLKCMNDIACIFERHLQACTFNRTLLIKASLSFDSFSGYHYLDHRKFLIPQI